MLQFNKMIYSNFTYFCENIQTLQGLRETACAPFIVSALITSTVPKWFSRGQKLVEHYRTFHKMVTVRPGLALSPATRTSLVAFGKQGTQSFVSTNRPNISLQIAP